MGIFRQFPYSNFHNMNLDQIIKIMREMQDEWEDTKSEWASYKDYIDNYFANLDVSEEVLAALRTMAADGTLNTIMDPTIASETAAWLSEHITPTTPAIDSSLTVAGAAADAKAAGDAIQKVKYISDTIANETGIYGFELTPNNQYPYYDLPIKIKSGVSYVITCNDINITTNLTELYLYDNTGGTRIKTLSLNNPTYFKAANDYNDVRLIVHYSAAPSNTVRGELNINSVDAEYLYKLKNASFNEIIVPTTSGSDVNVNIPVYGEIGDIIYLKIVDNDSVLAHNKKMDIGWAVNGTSYTSGKSITVANECFIILNNNYDPYSMRAYIARAQVAASGTFKLIYHNVTKDDKDFYYDKIGRPWNVTIPTFASTAVSRNFMPIYGDVGDIIKIKLTDTSALNNNYNVIVALYVNGAQTQTVSISAPLTTAYFQIPANYDYGKLEFYIAGGTVLNTNGLKYYIQNCTVAGITPPIRQYTSFEVLGDSYSSFKNHMTPADSRYWYPTNDVDAQGYGTGNNVDNIFEMWWYLLGRDTSLYMTKNVSYSGSTICYDSYGTGTMDGKETSFVERAVNLDDASVIFVFGGMNDQWAEVTIGDPQYSGWTDNDLTQFTPALCKVLNDIRNNHIGSDIVFIMPYYLNDEFKAAVITACTHYKVPYIELKRQDSVEGHPNENGMKQIVNAILEFLSQNYTLPYYE